MVRCIYFMGRTCLATALVVALMLACGGKDELAPPVAKQPTRSPTPTPTPAVTPKPTARPTPVPVPATPRPTSASAAVVTPAKAIEKEPADIPPEVQEVFDAMDRAFADSTARRVSIRARLEMMSGIRGYRSTHAVEMLLQKPNRMNIQIIDESQVQDRQTTTGWTQPSKMRWGMICDGETFLMKKGFSLKQNAPASLDDMLDRQIEITNWGDSPMISCFLKTRPSVAFKANLKRARLVQRTPQEIELELVTPPTQFIQEKKSIPASFDVVKHVTIDGRAMIPKRCYIELVDLSREIYRKQQNREVPVERAFLEIMVKTVRLKADFSGQRVFEIPKAALEKRGKSSDGKLTLGAGGSSP